MATVNSESEVNIESVGIPLAGEPIAVGAQVASELMLAFIHPDNPGFKEEGKIQFACSFVSAAAGVLAGFIGPELTSKMLRDMAAHIDEEAKARKRARN